MSVKITKDHVADVIRAISQLAKKDVLVGIPDSAPGRNDGPISNAAIGYIQETGSPAANIPARPFLIPGVKDAQKEIAARFGIGAKQALSGNAAGAENALHAAGLIGQNAARAKINTGPFDPLKASTLAARRRRGRTGTRPLVDTGQLRNSLTYVIRDKK